MSVEILNFNKIHTYIPECENDKIPYMNQCIDSLESAYDFYERYGRLCDFDVRQSSQKTNKQGIFFNYSRAGTIVYDKAQGGLERTRRTVSSKCDCYAKLVVGFINKKLVVVKIF